jgi:P4 family phage/plasmid primase-like protien
MIEPVPNAVLVELAELRPSDPRRAASGAGHRDIDVRAWCDVHGIAIRREKPWVNGATVFALEICVFNPDHTHGEAAIIKFASGRLLYKCLHASCVTKTWTHVRKLFGEAGTRRQERAGAQGPEHDTPATARDPDDTIRLTDVGNARRLVAEHGEDLRYCKKWKSWLVWDGRRWARDDRDQVIEYAKAVTAEFFRDAAAAHDPDTQGMLVGHALRSQRAERLRAMVLLAQSEPGIPVLPAELDADSYLLNVLNGTIDLRTGALREHRRTDLITKLAPIEYSPDAHLELWDRFLSEATAGCEVPEGPQAPDAAQNAAALRTFLQRAAGYSLTGDTGEEVLFLIHGPEAAGKSTFVESLKATLGDYALTADFETFLAKKGDGGVRNDVARLAGARFVASIEVEEGKKLAEGLVKQLTGGDTVTARFLFAESFEFTPTFKLWLAVNSAPRVTDQDGAIWRRILRVPFEHTVPKEKRDRTIKATLKNPAVGGPAILAWLVAGCLAWQREGLGVPPVIEAATAQYRADQDPLREFYAQCCVFEAQAWVASAALYATYQAWARENGVRQNQVLTNTLVGRRLRARGCVQKTGEIADATGQRKKARGWTGVRLRTEADAEADNSTGSNKSTENDSAKANKSTTDETNDSTTGSADEPGRAAPTGTADGPAPPDARSEQEHVGTRTSGSFPPTRARGDNKCEERVSTCSDPFREDCPAPRCPRCGDPAWAPPVDSGPGHCDRCGPVSCLDREPASDDGEDDGEVFE